MARVILNKSKKSIDFYYYSIKVHTGYPRLNKYASIETLLFQTEVNLVKVPQNVNNVKQDIPNKNRYEVWSERGDFN